MSSGFHRKLIIVYLIFFSLPGFSQISPGELAQVHAHLEGISNCTQCHTLGDEISNEKCLNCHTEIQSRISQLKGYHATAQVRGKRCIICHSDHHGRNFKIIKFDKDKFDHNLAGYKLEGAHSSKTCADCHKPGFVADKKLKTRQNTFLGLNTACASCHTDVHQKSLSSQCSDCHTFEKFTPASKFNHTRARFQLTGKHQDTDCAACHKVTMRNGQKFQQFKGFAFSKCTDCHKDVHENKFGQNCKECHNTQSFKAVGGVSNFDHDKTDFKLEGLHLRVACKQCHKVKLTSPLSYKKCLDCHSDYHEGQFTRNGGMADCSECHTVKGFSSSSFTIEQHNMGIFPLQGAHLATPCVACHKKEDKWKFRQIGSACRDCHTNIHRGFISEKYYEGESCSSCHNQSEWSKINFEHNKTPFPLEGAHAQKTCRDCHFKGEPAGHASQKFSGLGMQCTVCHKDVHCGQFENNGITDCKRCHTMESFLPVERFNHNLTHFPLDGKHEGLACNKCHKEIRDGNISYILYKISSFRCEDCHK